VGFEFGSYNLKNAKFGVAAHRDIVTAETRKRIADSVTLEFPDLWSHDDWWPARHRSLGDIPSDWLSDEFLTFARRVKRGEAEQSNILKKFILSLAKIADIVDTVLVTPPNATQSQVDTVIDSHSS
jgi:hypothetical protein